MVTRFDDVSDAYDCMLTLREAVELASSGATITFPDGVTTTQLKTTLYLEKRVTLQGRGTGKTILTGGTASKMFISISSVETVEIKDLAITDSKSNILIHNYSGGSSVSLKNCLFADNKAEGHLIQIMDADKFVMTNCLFSKNLADDKLLLTMNVPKVSLTDSAFQLNIMKSLLASYDTGDLLLENVNFLGNQQLANDDFQPLLDLYQSKVRLNQVLMQGNTMASSSVLEVKGNKLASVTLFKVIAINNFGAKYDGRFEGSTPVVSQGFNTFDHVCGDQPINWLQTDNVQSSSC